MATGCFIRCICLVLILQFCELWCSQALATNGMNMIGYGARSSGMGGADVAVAADCTGSTGNPAGMGIDGKHTFSLGLAVLAPQLAMHDSNNYDIAGDDLYFPLPQMSYSQPYKEDSPFIVGLNVFVQGGMGVKFQQLNTIVGTVDEVESRVSYLRFTGSLNYLASDKLSFGVGLMAGYIDMGFSVFPNSYSMGMDNIGGTADDFVGIDASGLSNYGFAGRIGAQYQLSDDIRLGLQYTSESILDPKGRDMTLNFGEMKVRYESEAEGFTWPQEIEAGLAFQPFSELLLAADVKWLNWSGAMDMVRVKGFNPSHTGVPSDIVMSFNMSWNDQWVFALGAEYSIGLDQKIRLGYNYGKNPVPDDNLTPLFPAIVEHHLTVGYSYLWSAWRFDFAYEHGFSNRQQNNNPGPPFNDSGIVNPFGAGVEVSHSQDVFHFQLCYFF